MKRLLFCIALLLMVLSNAQADEYRPAYLELRQTSEDIFDLLWKVPARGQDMRLALYLDFPDDVKSIGSVRSSFIGNAYIERSTISRRGGLSGVEIRIEGLTRVATDVLVRIERLDGSTEVARLTASTPSFVVTAAANTWDVAKTYLVFGMLHIWQGTDHLLFVACLVLIAGSWKRILITITGFTIAHSVTLSLAALELVHVPVPPIEAMIALSIVFLAREIALDRRDTLTWRYPIVVSATFGLLHGFGFASALAEIGLPKTEIPAALLAFNLGVEIGQVVFVGAIIAAAGLGKMCFQKFIQNPFKWMSLIENPVAYTIGGITMFWTLERVSGFWI